MSLSSSFVPVPELPSRSKVRRSWRMMALLLFLFSTIPQPLLQAQNPNPLPAQRLPQLPDPVEAPPSLLAPPSSPADRLPVAAAPSANPNPTVNSSTSASKQFIVHGADLKTRSVFCLLADETASSLAKLLKDNSLDRLPVVIVLKTAAEAQRIGDAVSFNITQLAHGGFHLQINVQLRQGFQITQFNNTLVQILLAERILRQHKELNSQRKRVLPYWLMTGVTQALTFRERAKPSLLFAAVFRGGRVYSIDAILEADPTQLDALSRGIYETSTCALVLTLLDQPDGAQRFNRFLSSLATDAKSDRELLQQHFPGLGASENSLEKWWSLQMVTLATPSALETMGVSETERLLQEALTLRYDPEAPTRGKSKSTTNSASSGTNAGSSSPSQTQNPNSSESSTEEKPEKPSRFQLPFFKSRKKDIIFPFRKRKDDKEESTTTNPESSSQSSAAVTAKDKLNQPATPPSLPPKPASQRDISDSPTSSRDQTMPSHEVRSLPRKQDDTRKVSEQPVLPPTAPSKTKKNEENENSSPDHSISNLLNPFQWFRKDSPQPETPADSVTNSNSTSTLQSQSATAPATSVPQKTLTEETNSIIPFLPQEDQASMPQPLPFPSLTDPTNPAVSSPSANSLSQDHLITAPLSSFENILKRSDRGIILQPSLDRLNALRQRGHPLYRPLITEYIQIVKNLMQGKDKGVKDRLAYLDQQHQHILTQARDVEVFVDTYIANHSGFSDTFKDYLDLCDRIENEMHPRNDPISEYLDTVEKVYQQH